MSVVINGSAGVTTNSGAVYNGIQAGTAVASTSGTSIDFTGIPSWVKKVTVMFSGVSTNGSSNYQVQIGSNSVTTSGYLGSATTSGAGSATANFTAGFGIYNNNGASNVFHGVMTLTLLNGNTWVESHAVGCSNTTNSGFGGGSISLSGALDRVRITTVNGTDTFDAGSINILYE